MSIAEKLKTVAENEAKVKNAGFVAGYDVGFVAGKDESFSDGYDSGYDAGHEDGWYDGVASGVTLGIERGKQAEYDAFWDACQDNGNRTNYENAFAGQGWTEENFRPKYDMRPTNSYMMFRGSHIRGDLVQILEDCGVILDMSLCSGWIQYPFGGLLASRLGVIDFSKAVMLYEAFGNCINLHTIDELILSKKCEETTAFRGCTSLANLKISGEIGKPFTFQWSPLTKASITSVINALSTTTSGLTVTFSLTAVNNAFTGGSEGSEWQALIDTKKNWAFSLV